MSFGLISILHSFETPFLLLNLLQYFIRSLIIIFNMLLKYNLTYIVNQRTFYFFLFGLGFYQLSLRDALYLLRNLFNLLVISYFILYLYTTLFLFMINRGFICCNISIFFFNMFLLMWNIFI